MSKPQERLREIFDLTVESDLKYDGLLEEMSYYNAMCKAAAKDVLFKLFGSNLCMFNFIYEENDAVLMLFSIPLNESSGPGAKHIAERVMEVVGNVEEVFTTVEHMESKEVKEDRFVYVTIVKKIEEKEEDD